MKELIEKLEKSAEFKEFKAKNNGAYLTHLFVMLEKGKDISFDVGYCVKDEGMVSFTIDDNGGVIGVREEKEVFKKPGQSVLELDVNKVKLGLNQAVDNAILVQKEKYKQHRPSKTIVILQNIGGKQLWNITFVTETFKTLNIKIDADSGEMVSDDLIELFQFNK